MAPSCTLTEGTIQSKEIRLQPFNRNEYVVMNRARGEAISKRFWVLFIPIGGISDENLNERAYNDAMRKAIDTDADGLLEPRFTYERKIYPFIAFTYIKKVAIVDGRTFRIKTEEEYQAALEEEAERFKAVPATIYLNNEVVEAQKNTSPASPKAKTISDEILPDVEKRLVVPEKNPTPQP